MKINIKKFLVKYKILIMFLLFLIFLLFQHKFLWLYHDDYGYASLSYTNTVEGVIGHSFTLGKMFEFLGDHYNVWGGRILYFAIECILLGKSLTIFRAVQSVIICLIFYYIYLIVSKYNKIDKWVIALLSIFSYGLIEIMVIRSGVFWITASVLYIFPLLPLLMFVYYYDSNKKNSIIFNIFIALLLFFASFSQEQIGISALAYIIILSGFDFYHTKKINKKNICMIVISLIGFLILMLAPGNEIRMQSPTSVTFYELSLFEKIRMNYPNLILNIFSIYSKLFVTTLFLSLTYISYINLNFKKTKNKIINIINILSFVSTFIILFVTISSNGNYFATLYDLFNNNIIKLFILIIFTIQIALILYSITIYLSNRKLFNLLFLCYVAVISQAVMIVAPYYPLRSVLIFEIIYFILIIYAIADFVKNNKNMVFNYSLVFVFIIITGLNLFIITRGYYRNDYINNINNTILMESSEKISNGDNMETIKLFKLKDGLFSGDQPYYEGNEYIMTWIKKYYNIPENVELIYQ